MIIVVTGASKGIGRAIVEQFAEAGFTLLVCARGDVALYELVKTIQERFPLARIHARSADLSVQADTRIFADWCLEFGTPDVLINNAGRFVQGGILDADSNNLEEMMATNLYSAVNLTKALLHAMIAKGSGHIFNMCSIASLQAYTSGGAYSISKFALLGFSKNLREELKPLGIKVTAVMPGAVYTDSWSGSGVDPNRIMEAQDIAKMVFAAAMLSPQAVVEDIVLRPQLGDL